MPVIVAKI